MGDNGLNKKKDLSKPRTAKEPEIYQPISTDQWWTNVKPGQPSVIPDPEKHQAIERYIARLRDLEPKLPELPIDEQLFLEQVYHALKSDPDKADLARAEAESLLRGTILPEGLLTAPDDWEVVKGMAKEKVFADKLEKK